MSAPKYCDDPDNCGYADCPTAFCDRNASTHSLQRVVRAHAGDCTIYAALINGTPLDGICTCGYGWECVRHSDWDKMFSAEWLEANKRPNGPS